MTIALTNARVLTDTGIATGKAVLIDGGLISNVVPECEVPPGARIEDLNGEFLLPGFVDVQVNGGGGILFGDDFSVAGIRRIAEAHRHFGTTSLMPTLISGTLEQIGQAIMAVDRAIEAGVSGIVGVHIEGPFLSAARKGIHDETRFRSLNDDAVALLTSAKRGKTLVTLAPEMTTPETIEKLVKAGVIVSAGHTDATYAQIRAGLDQGMTGFTHLFNAMSPMLSRDPGAVGAALEDRESWCGIIVDGRHVDPVVLRIALRAKRADRMMLVTDAMPSVGTKDTFFMLGGRKILVENDACIGLDGTLAGSNLDMASALRNAVSMLKIDLATAARMASRNAAAFLGLSSEIGWIAPGMRANLVSLTQELHVTQTWIDGQVSQQ